MRPLKAGRMSPLHNKFKRNSINVNDKEPNNNYKAWESAGLGKETLDVDDRENDIGF